MQQFWEQFVKSVQIIQSDEIKLSCVKLNKKWYSLKETILFKNLQLGERSEVLITIYMKNKELREQFKNDPNNLEIRQVSRIHPANQHDRIHQLEVRTYQIPLHLLL